MEAPPTGHCRACKHAPYMYPGEFLCTMCYLSPYYVARRKAKMEIVAFIGVVGSGKDFQAQRYRDQFGYARVDFKDGLLDMVSDLAGYNVRSDYDWFKKAPVGMMRGSDFVQAALNEKAVETTLEHYPMLMTGRRLLQRLGTNVMRKRDPDYWVRAWKSTVGAIVINRGSVAVADCRFGNEVNAVAHMCANRRFIFCDYRSARYDPSAEHESEYLAQALLAMGLKDGQEITPTQLQEAVKKMEERKHESLVNAR